MSKFMTEAFKEAKKAFENDEVPIGAVIVVDGKIVARGHNKREKKQNALAHAEIVALNKACKKLGSWRLDNAQIYVTLEPCPMCAGAIANARIEKIVYGVRETSSDDELCKKICDSTRLNHKLKMEFEECPEAKQLLQQFFKSKRATKV